MRFLVVGAGGQLGREFSKHLSLKGSEFLALKRSELELSRLILTFYHRFKAYNILWERYYEEYKAITTSSK
jgi:RmlD substrate binding domain.